MTKRADSIKFIFGSKGNDNLKGSAGKDVVVGRQGDDAIQGGAGKDVLYGDDVFSGKFWGCKFGGWWHGGEGGNDFLDGGAGSDLVFGGRGNDLLQYSMAGNLGASFANIGTHDVYDGGKGSDTLKLQLTYGESGLASVQQDIAAFQAFLARAANPLSDHGKTFEFKSFDLDARNFESLQIELVNSAPVARNDAGTTDENTPLKLAPASVLANDSDPDHLDVAGLVDADAVSALGAQVTLGADGSLLYDPSAALELQQLAQGATAVDSFSYTIDDLAGARASAAVQVTVTGVNDDPVAMHDVVTLPVTSGGGSGPATKTITFEGALNPPDGTAPIVDGFSFQSFSISPTFGEGNFSSFMAYAGTTNNNAGGAGDADGAIRYGSAGDEFGVVSLSIAAFFIEPTVTIVGYRDGQAVAGAEQTVVALGLYAPVNFGAAWSSIDELRFYARTDDGSLDYILIDNLKVELSSGGGGGTPQAEPVNIDVLGNDKDVDDGAALALLSFDDTSVMGALISQNADGTLRYDPSGMDLPSLAPGETKTDSFDYTITDEYGATSTASVSVALTGADVDTSLIASLDAPDVNLL